MSEAAPSTHAGVFRVLGVGARAARRSASLWGFGLALQGSLDVARLAWAIMAGAIAFDAFLRGAAAANPESGLPQAIAHGLDALLSNRVVIPVLGLAAMLEVLAAVLRAFYLGGAVDWLTAAAKGGDQPAGGVVVHGAAAFARAVAAFVWLALIEFIVGLWRWVAVGAGYLVVTTALAHRAHGVRAALFGGIVAGLIGVVVVVNALFARVYLVRAIRGPAGSLPAVGEALDLLRQRAPTYLALAIAEGLLFAMVSAVAGAPGVAGAGVGPEHLGFQVGLRLVGVAISAVLGVAVELIVLGAVCAVDLDSRGELPAPPQPPWAPAPAEPVYEAQAILVAEAMPPPPAEPAS